MDEGEGSQASGEHRLGDSRLERFTRLNRYPHHVQPAVEVVELVSLGTKTRVAPTVGGDLPLASRPGKGLHVDFQLAGFVRLVDDPPAVGRKTRTGLSKGTV